VWQDEDRSVRQGLWPVCAVAVALLTACGSSGPAGSHSSAASAGGAGPATSTHAGPSPSSHTETISYASNGKTVYARVGAGLRVVLDSTYWTVNGSSSAKVLAASGPVRHVPQRNSRSCVPGAGCGSVSQSFVAVASGRASITAHRTVCGEAMACRPDQQNFVITVVVS
jgi:photosystem II stability/assembly factor-like uncharacterized protein